MEIYKEYDSLYILERNAKKLIIFASMAVFVSYCPQFWCPGVIYQAHDTQYIFERHDQEGHFCELLSIILGFRGDLHEI
jgi:hypothetical protein